jgi:polyketide cyclase/dehydrase/lipid transport protein
MTTIERSVELDLPAAEVWAVLEDVRQIPRYSPSTVAVADAPEQLSAAGQRFRQTVVVLGIHYESERRRPKVWQTCRHAPLLRRRHPDGRARRPVVVPSHS